MEPTTIATSLQTLEVKRLDPYDYLKVEEVDELEVAKNYLLFEIGKEPPFLFQQNRFELRESK